MKTSSKWLKMVATEEMDSTPLIGLFSDIAKRLPKTENTLCIGCGDGTELDFFSNSKGIDINPLNKTSRVDTGDMHDLPYKDGEFEMVFAKDVFEHAISPIIAIDEMARVSSKYVAIVVPDESWQESGWHFIIPTMRQMMSLAEKVGLKLKYMREIWYGEGAAMLVNYLYLFEK